MYRGTGTGEDACTSAAFAYHNFLFQVAIAGKGCCIAIELVAGVLSYVAGQILKVILFLIAAEIGAIAYSRFLFFAACCR